MDTAAPISQPPVDSDNPWPGLASFTEEWRGFFYGRESETDELSRLVRRQTLTVLFGQSGLGKSSLIQAGLFPLLREGDHLPLYLRLDHAASAPPLADQVKAALAAAFAAARADAPAFRPDETLWEYFHRKDVDIWSAKNRLLTPILAFDQFEEIFTLGRADDACSARSRAFLADLACLVENRPPSPVQDKLDRGELDPGAFNFEKPSCQVILSLREDFLPDLEGLKHEMPALIHNRLRLKKLNGIAALDVVQKPAPHLLAPGVAERIVEFVAGARGGSAERLAELDVEPPLLSVICRELNERRRALGQSQITADLVSGNRREILHDFYERSVADLPAPVRAFVEDRLLTKSGFRDNLALETALEFPGVTRALLDTLVARRLLRIEERLGVQRVELTHDVLAEVIRASRDERQQRLSIAVSAREARHQRRIIAGLATVVVALCIGAVFGLRAQHRAEQAARDEAAQSSRTDFIFAGQLLGQDRVTEGLAYLVRAARSDPANSAVGSRLMSALAWRSFAEPVGELMNSAESLTWVRYSRDGRRALGYGQNNRVRYWDLKSGKLLLTVDTQTHLVDVTESPDGRRMATAGADGTIRVWDSATGQPMFGPFQLGSGTTDLTFSPDGRWLGASGSGGESKIWDTASGALKATLKGSLLVSSIDFSPAGNSVLTTTYGDGARIWRVPQDDSPPQILFPSHVLNVGLFSPDGKIVCLGGNGGGGGFFDAATGASVGSPFVMNGIGVTFAVFSADGRRLAMLRTDRSAEIREVPTGRLLAPPLRHDDTLHHWASFSADSRLLATVTADGAAHIWDTATGEPALEPIRTGDVSDVHFSPDGAELLTGGHDGVLRRWHIAPGAVQPWHLPPDPDRLGAFLTADKSAVWIFTNKWLQKRDLRTGREIAPPKPMPAIGSPSTVSYVELSRGDQFAGVRLNPDRVVLLDLRGPEVLSHDLPGHSNKRFFSFSPDGTLAAVGDGDGTLRVWNTATASLAFEQVRDPGWASIVRYSPDSRKLAVISVADGVLRFIDLTSHAISEAPQYGAEVNDMAFSPDGGRIAIETWDGRAQIRDSATARPIGPLLSHRDFIQAPEFSADGTRLLTRSPDAVRIWDAQSAAPLTDPLSGGRQAIGTAAFSSDGTMVATGNRGGEVLVWSTISGQMLFDPIHVESGIRNYQLNFDATGRFLTFSTVAGDFYAWPLPLTPAGQPAPDWLLRLATAVAGGTVDSRATFRAEASDARTLENIRRELDALPADAPYADWGRWFLADRATRPIGPGFTMTAAEAARAKPR